MVGSRGHKGLFYSCLCPDVRATCIFEAPTRTLCLFLVPRGVRNAPALRAASLGQGKSWKDMEYNNTERLAKALEEIQAREREMRALVARSKDVMARDRILSKAAAQVLSPPGPSPVF